MLHRDGPQMEEEEEEEGEEAEEAADEKEEDGEAEAAEDEERPSTSGRKLVVAALLEGCTSREQIIAHVMEHSSFGKRSQKGPRSSIMTTLADEKRCSIQLWTQDADTYQLTADGGPLN